MDEDGDPGGPGTEEAVAPGEVPGPAEQGVAELVGNEDEDMAELFGEQSVEEEEESVVPPDSVPPEEEPEGDDHDPSGNMRSLR